MSIDFKAIFQPNKDSCSHGTDAFKNGGIGGMVRLMQFRYSFEILFSSKIIRKPLKMHISLIKKTVDDPNPPDFSYGTAVRCSY